MYAIAPVPDTQEQTVKNSSSESHPSPNK